MKSLLWDIDIETGITQRSYNAFARYLNEVYNVTLQKIIANKGIFVLDLIESDDRMDIILSGPDFSDRLRTIDKTGVSYRLSSESFAIDAFEEELVAVAVLLSLASSKKRIEDVLSERFRKKIELLREKRDKRFESNQKVNLDELDEWDWRGIECECCGLGSSVVYETADGKHILCPNCERAIHSQFGEHAIKAISRRELCW